ncbi:VPLPA-CTERM sorting domain-containing protein [Paracoccus subflavus]|nr:VPLPA-CTERM sorting domain-containing protein [Paracoccus subflavus]
MLMVGGTAHAATYTASSIIEDETSYGVCTSSAASCAADDRRTITNVLGSTDGAFYSLGKGGELTVGFDMAVFTRGATVVLEEVTFKDPLSSRHFEAVDLYSIMGGVMKLVTTVYNTSKTATVNISHSFEYLKLVDVTSREYASTTSFDGYDIDSITLTPQPVPVPAAGLLLLGGIAGFAVLRRRKAAA